MYIYEGKVLEHILHVVGDVKANATCCQGKLPIKKPKT